jgi:heat shock 70kDa protein 1/2/6/8
MVHDAERYHADDERARERVNARNRLETYSYSCKQAVENYNGSAVSDSDRSSIINACDEAQRWLDRSQLAEKEEIDHQYKQLERKCQRVMTKMHGDGGQYGRNGSHNDGHYSGPRVEEVD